MHHPCNSVKIGQVIDGLRTCSKTSNRSEQQGYIICSKWLRLEDIKNQTIHVQLSSFVYVYILKIIIGANYFGLRPKDSTVIQSIDI